MNRIIHFDFSPTDSNFISVHYDLLPNSGTRLNLFEDFLNMKLMVKRQGCYYEYRSGETEIENIITLSCSCVVDTTFILFSGNNVKIITQLKESCKSKFFQ